MDIVVPRQIIVLLHPAPLPLHNQMMVYQHHQHRLRGVLLLVAEEWWGMEYASTLMNVVPSMDFVGLVENIARRTPRQRQLQKQLLNLFHRLVLQFRLNNSNSK